MEKTFTFVLYNKFHNLIAAYFLANYNLDFLLIK